MLEFLILRYGGCPGTRKELLTFRIMETALKHAGHCARCSCDFKTHAITFMWRVGSGSMAKNEPKVQLSYLSVNTASAEKVCFHGNG